MTGEELKRSFSTAFEDKKFVNKLAEIESVEEAQKAFAQKGINLSIEDVQKIGDLFSSDGELDESDLENVTGGSISAGVILIGAAWIGITFFAGMVGAGWSRKKKKK